MATDYWASSHNKKWVTDRLALHNSRLEDLACLGAENLAFLNIFFANLISKIGKKLHFRQRVVATATVFLRRFYLKNSLMDTDPYIVLVACFYVAGKAEELPIHIKSLIAVANPIFQELGIWTVPPDNHRLAEMEFYLVDELECDLTVFHPYRTLTTLCSKDLKESEMAAELAASIRDPGNGVENGERYWGTGVGKLVLHEKPLQLACMIINDTYRTDICLLYPPFLIAIAAIYLSLVNSDRIRTQQPSQSTPDEMQITPEAVAPTPASNAGPTPAAGATSPSQAALTVTATSTNPDPITFLASLNVSLASIATIVQEMISFYTLSLRYVDESSPSSSTGNSSGRNKVTEADVNNFLMDVDGKTPGGVSAEKVRPKQLVEMLKRRKGEKERDLEGPMMSAGTVMSPVTAASAHTIKGRAVNKRLERAQAAG